MLVQIGLEHGWAGRSLAWALDHPGCFAYGEDGPAAVIAMARAIPAYIAWLEGHTDRPWFDSEAIDIRLVEEWEDYAIDAAYRRTTEGHLVRAWFQTDWRPLTSVEIERGLQVLTWARADLLASVSLLNPSQMEARLPREKRSIRELLLHLAAMERESLRYLEVPACTVTFSDDIYDQLKTTRTYFEQALWNMAGQEKVVGKQGEFWSPRKLLRRAAWHEIQHANQIQFLCSLV